MQIGVKCKTQQNSDEIFLLISFTGGMSIGVPGMLKGFELVHKRHGKRPWRDIFETAAKLAERQNNINPFFLKHLYKDIAKYEKTEFKDFRYQDFRI